MQNVLDYIYHRVHTWYKKNGDQNPDEGALVIMTLMSFLIILDLIILFTFLPTVLPIKKAPLIIIKVLGY
jgi:hypothetical protein